MLVVLFACNTEKRADLKSVDQRAQEITKGLEGKLAPRVDGEDKEDCDDPEEKMKEKLEAGEIDLLNNDAGCTLD